MDDELAKQVAQKVLQDNQVWIAMIGLVGGIVGAFLLPLGTLLVSWVQHRKEKKLDKGRTKLLQQMLDISDWQKLSTLRSVIGADRETTTRLLIEMKARGSEEPRADGEELWGLIKKHPLPKG
jgi:hypothetical protein